MNRFGKEQKKGRRYPTFAPDFYNVSPQETMGCYNQKPQIVIINQILQDKLFK